MKKYSFSSVDPFLRRYWPFLPLFLGINLFVIYYLQQERYIYFWDFSGHWMMYQDFGNLLKQVPPFHAIKKLMTTVQYYDYNLLPIFPLMPFYFLFGEGRLPYILAIVNLYACSSIFLFSFLFKLFFPSPPGKHSFLPYLFSLTLALLPQFWIPVLRGLPDVVGVLILTIILLLYFRQPIERQSIKHLVLMGFLLVLMTLMRRWYAFWVVSFFILVFLDGIFFRFPAYRFEIKKYLPALRNILLIGITSAFLLFLIATPMAKRMLLTDYSDIHSAYRDYDSSIVPIKRIFEYFGVIPIFLFLLGSLFSILDKRTRRCSLFLSLQMILIFFLFSPIQTFGPTHLYLFIPTIVVFMSLIVVRILNSRPILSQILFLVPFVLAYSISFSCVLIPKGNAYFGPFTSLLVGKKHLPLVRKDIGEFKDLLTTMDHLIQSKNDSIYVLSSSYTFNEDILINASRINHMTVHKHILPVYHVDKRDGFPRQFWDAKYVIVGEPVQYHLNPNDQRIIGILADQILHHKDIGSFYERLPYQFSFDNHVTVSIYEKKASVKKADMEELMKLFIGYYPDKKAKFKINRLPCEIYAERPKDLVTPLDVDYSNKVRFLGVTSAKLAENRLEISYYWQIMDDLGPYISFVHFTDAKNHVLFQNDHAIGPVRSYEELIGKFIKETHFLDIPPSAVNKEVYVKVGLFSPERLDRLKVRSPKDIPVDELGARATVGKINL